MTSVFDVLAFEDDDGVRNTRHATIAAHARVESVYGEWIRQDPVARLAHIKSEIEAIAHQVCDEFGTARRDDIARAIIARYQPKPQVKTASMEHEAGRMPRMCPFHKDVTEISLNASDPAAGFSAMAQHWGGPRHCEGEGYEGESCKFKPQMTTQSYWDARAEKAEQRKQEREQAAELEAVQQAENAEAEAEFAEPLEQETEIPDNVIEFPTQEAPAEAVPEAEVPMSMAAKTADKDTTGLGGPEPKMDKSKWSPKALPEVDDADGRNPTRRKDIVDPIKPDNNSWPPEEIGKQVTERQDVTKDVDNIKGDDTGTWTEGPTTAVSSVDTYRNPILDLLDSNYDGFTPEAVVAKAIVSHKRR